MAGKKREDRERSRNADDIMGISHGGGQSGGGAYASAHSGHAVPQGGGRAAGGQSVQGYHGGGQMGDRNLGASSHNAASRANVPEDDDVSRKGEGAGDERKRGEADGEG